MSNLLIDFCVGFAFGWTGMNAITNEDERINSGVPAVFLLVAVINLLMKCGGN
jgi:hypothetical protein